MPNNTQSVLAARQRLSPLFVVSPSTRCGSTFVQRLLNSSGDVLIYGENPTLIEGLPIVLGAVIANYSGARAEAKAATRHRSMNEGTDDWIPDLSPEPSGYLDLSIAQMVEQFLFYEEDAKAFDRTNWGLKFPLRDATVMAVIAHVLPQARFIVLYRDVAAALASARGRHFVTDEASARLFVQRWSANLVWLINWSARRKLDLRYEDLVANPEEHLPKLQAFAGIGETTPEVFANRLNTFRGDGVGQDISGYVPPIALSEADHALIDEIAGPGRRAAGYL
jgi:hypothetical protein